MSKVPVDRDLLERMIQLDSLGLDAQQEYSALRTILAQPAEADGPSFAEVLEQASVIQQLGAKNKRIDELQASLSAVTAERDRLESMLIRTTTRHFAQQWKDRADDKKLDECLSEGIAMLEAERDQLRAEVETWRAAARWSAVRMSGMLASAQYSMTAETTHEVLELHHHVLAGTPEKIEWLAAMSAKEA